ncbi:MAG TPA: SDR family NAD(P)-dependent oxidoreductase [Candidatus Binataceae bacterium]|nr:SDR family NAD(P)-dependent oxidoreductase [Candidatus Binataceae bacterium]
MAQSKKSKVAVVVGVGAGTGASLARRFASDYAIALIARNGDYLRSLGDELRAAGGDALEAPADVGDASAVAAAFATIRERLGDPDLLLYNAGSGTWGTIAEITPAQYEADWRVNAFGAFLCAKEVAPAMIKRGAGAMLFTGATAGVKAGAKSVSFGPAKFAMRGLAQSLARDLGPRGIHVVWINVDGAIAIPRVRERYPQMKDEDMLKPDAIAETYWHLAHQDRSAWTMELEVRPFKEKF